MSKFSAYLKELLEQRGEPIARIAKNTGLERTSIHKALKDERMLPYTALRQLGQYLQLTLPQMRELNQYYEMLLRGEDLYYIQKTICGLLADLSQMHFSCQGPVLIPERAAEAPASPGIVYGRPQVEAAIQAVLQWETEVEGAELELYLPPACRVPDCLLPLWRAGREFTVRQLVAFRSEQSSGDTRQENLRRLQHLLPLSLVSGGRYFAYYYFEQNGEAVSIDPLTYFIITPRQLIRMDANLSVAQFQSAPELLHLYRNRLGQILAECQLLNSYSNDPELVLEAYMKGTDLDSYYVMMTQPCLGHYYTRERIAGQFWPDVPEREKLVELSDRRFERLRKLENNYFTIFTEEGLRQFAADGVEVDLPPELVRPIEVPLRRQLLEEFRQDIQEERIRACMADPEHLPIPPYLTITCDPRFGVHIYAVQGFIGGAYACNLHIEEGGIGQSFCSFIRSLPGSKFVHPKEKLLAVLDELIGQLA